MVDKTTTGQPTRTLRGGPSGNHFPDFHHDRSDLFEGRLRALEANYEPSRLEQLEQLEQRIKELEDRMDALTGPPENVDPLKTVL